MLRGIRKASANWLGRAVMGVVMTLLAGSFAVWGINDIFHGFGRTYVAKIGDTEIPVEQFRRAYNDRVQDVGHRLGHPLAPEEVVQLGIARQVLVELVTNSGLDQLARQMRLIIPDAEIVHRITTNPIFQTPTGQFDRARFEAIIHNAGFTEQSFVADQRGLILRRQITDSIRGDIMVPKAWLDAVNQFQNQQRSIDYVTLGPAQAGDVPPPTPEELSQYFEVRKILFRAPEYRKIVVLAATPAQLASSIEVSDDDVKQAYEQNIRAYSTPERRHIEQIVFPNVADAQAASARLKGGMTFAALAAERGLKQQDIDLGLVPKSGLIDPGVADTAFSLKLGEVSEPVQGRFGAVIVTVLEIQAAEIKPLNVVAPFIRNDIAVQRAKAQVQDIYNKVEDARAGGATLQEAAAKLQLKVVTYDALDRSGRDPAGKLVTALPDAGDVVAAAFSSDVGVDNEPIEADGGYVWYEVTGVTPAHDRTLDEVKSQVEERWRGDQIASRLKAKAVDMIERLKNGGTLDALAATDGLKLETAKDIKRGTNGGPVPQRAIDAIFHTVKDGFGSAEGDSPSAWIVFRVSEITTPDLDPASNEGKNLNLILQRQTSDDILSQYFAWLESYLGTNINQAALAQAVGSGSPDNE
jgi:peptidyl-prolyl cis-trans isomerase D